MSRNRTVYLIMIGIGFVIAIFVGLWLAIQVSTGEQFGNLLGVALVGFVPSAVFAGYGMYQYIQSDEEPDVIPEVDVRHQRELVDLVHERGAITVAQASQLLEISEIDVKESVRQLLELGIFTGDIDWETDTLYSQKVKKLN